jgi:DNA-binding NarL/FixJ family response regulator
VLTNREPVVVQLIAEGHTSKLLHVSLKTVETHRRNVLMKLNLPSSAAMVRYAIRNKLVRTIGSRLRATCWFIPMSWPPSIRVDK